MKKVQAAWPLVAYMSLNSQVSEPLWFSFLPETHLIPFLLQRKDGEAIFIPYCIQAPPYQTATVGLILLSPIPSTLTSIICFQVLEILLEMSTVFRPQLRLEISPNLLIGILVGIPTRRSEGMHAFLRLIWEPPHSKRAAKRGSLH